jgi:hypothetical protein
LLYWKCSSCVDGNPEIFLSLCCLFVSPVNGMGQAQCARPPPLPSSLLVLGARLCRSKLLLLLRSPITRCRTGLLLRSPFSSYPLAPYPPAVASSHHLIVAHRPPLYLLATNSLEIPTQATTVDANPSFAPPPASATATASSRDSLTS